MHHRLRLGQVDRHVAFAVLSTGGSGKRGHTASANATLFAENIAHFYIAATLEHRAGDKKYTLNNNNLQFHIQRSL